MQQLIEANFDDTLPNQRPRNNLAASTKVVKEKARMNEKDNMLKYQISDNKEENDLLEGVMNEEKPDHRKDGDMISTELANKT